MSVVGTVYITEYEQNLLTILREVIQHGFGEISISINETRNFKTKVMIVAGKSYVYFLDKEPPDFRKEHAL